MSTTERHLLRSLRELGTLTVAEHTLPEMLQKVVGIAKDGVVGTAMAGITLEVDGEYRTAVFTDEVVAEVDSVQYTTGIGPCVDATRRGLPFAIPSTANNDRWKAFSDACITHGVLSTLSTPVLPKSRKRGALNFYATTEGAFDSDAVDVAAAFAMQAALAIDNAEAYWSVRALADQLQVALDSRIVIEQAKGLLMAGGRTADEAFEILRDTSQHQNRKLRDVANEVVADAGRRGLAAS
jgi:GAF domain-containing protein